MEKELVFQDRMKRHHDELRWLYMELYDNSDMFGELCQQMYRFYEQRSSALVSLDEERSENSQWYRDSKMMGMMLYVDNFAGNLQGVREHLDYIRDCNVSCIHLMPFLETPKGKSDGGYAVADYRKVEPGLGDMQMLQELASDCHKKGMSLCMDFVMNHTSEEHEWARRARNKEGEYMSRYFFYQDSRIPMEYERTVPQVFPETAPGNFTYLEEMDHYVMTTFYPYQWDLNYKNPRVFNEMMYHFLYLANQGIDIFRLDAVPYIWKEIGTSCRNLPQVHSLVRMMRMIGEIVCPGVLLLGEVVMEPEKVVPYFGTTQKPQCHMLYNVTTMATIWSCLAASDVRLLKKQIDTISHLPASYTFLNYLRCHDDIGWGLDYDTLKEWQMEEVSHKRFLNDFYTGRFPGSYSRGELYNEDPVTQDARFCGTAASMCGIEEALALQDERKMEEAVRRDLMLHACMFMLPGIPMLYSGDEIGQLNDYTYHYDPDKAADSRYVHRGRFLWEEAKKRKEQNTFQSRIFKGLKKLEKIRAEEKAFHNDSSIYTIETGDCALLKVVRCTNDEFVLGIYNFSNMEKETELPEDRIFEQLGDRRKKWKNTIRIAANDFVWLKEKR